MLGGVLRTQRRLGESNEYFSKALDLQPDNTGIRRNLAASQFQMGKFEEVRASLNRVLRINPEDHQAMILKGMACEGTAGIHQVIMSEPLIGPKMVGMTLLAIPPFVEDLVHIIGGQVNCTRYVPAGQHTRISEEVANTIGEENAVLLANHGVTCCGRDLEEAFVASQILEKAAFMMFAAGAKGAVIPVPEEHVRSERHRFLNEYGTSSSAPTKLDPGKP